MIDSLFDPDTDSDPDADKAEIVLFTTSSKMDRLPEFQVPLANAHPEMVTGAVTLKFKLPGL